MSDLLVRARHQAGLSQEQLASAAGTSRPTLSAYERGRKSPTLVTVEKITFAAGFVLELAPIIHFRDVSVSRGRYVTVPDRLWRLPIRQALAHVTPPLHLNWSDRGRRLDLSVRRERNLLYEIVLREGAKDDLLAYMDGLLLLDAWPDLFLPRDVRRAWDRTIKTASEREVVDAGLI